MLFSVPFLICISEKSAGSSTGSQSPSESKGRNSRLVLVKKYKEVEQNNCLNANCADYLRSTSHIAIRHLLRPRVSTDTEHGAHERSTNRWYYYQLFRLECRAFNSTQVFEIQLIAFVACFNTQCCDTNNHPVESRAGREDY